jgi:DNA-binding MurR/RpiR family transcriptional regulator
MATPDEGALKPARPGERPAIQRVRAVLAQPEADKLTSTEVARQAGVSKATVERVRKDLLRGGGLLRLRKAWAAATAEEKRQFLDEVIQEERQATTDS